MVEEIKNTQEIQGKSKISDWDKMKKKMKDYFFSFKYTQTLY